MSSENYTQTFQHLTKKLANIKAYIFDWDGVFNEGIKSIQMHSTFAEIDAMGINLLRFQHFLYDQMPIISIMTGADNLNAKAFAKRENFNSVYTKIKDKKQALVHFMEKFQLKKEAIAFFFDDVIDLSVAQAVGLRICVRHKNTYDHFLTHYIQQKQWADYITKGHGGQNAIRETTELFLKLSQKYETVLSHRIDYTPSYQKYLAQKTTIQTQFYTTA